MPIKAHRQVAGYRISPEEEKALFKKHMDSKNSELLSTPTGYVEMITDTQDTEGEYLWSWNGDNFKD